MVRIFFALASFATLLFVANLVMAFVLGDFGAASRDFTAAKRDFEEIRRNRLPSSTEFQQALAELERRATDLRDQRTRFWPHIWLGIVASLVSLLVNSISITYFIGTSRWCREVSEAYSMPEAMLQRSQRLKRRSFVWSLVGILLTLAIAGLGAAADPFASTSDPARWVAWHWMLSLGGIVIIAIAFYRQQSLVAENQSVIQAVLDAAAEIRAAREANLANQA